MFKSTAKTRKILKRSRAPYIYRNGLEIHLNVWPFVSCQLSVNPDPVNDRYGPGKCRSSILEWPKDNPTDIFEWHGPKPQEHSL